MRNSLKNEDVEFALHVLNHPETRDDDNVQAWLGVKEHRDLLEELRHYREAGLREKRGLFQDMEKQWFQFQVNNMPVKTNLRFKRIFMTATAVIILFISVGIWINYYVRQTERGINGITMSQASKMEVKLITGEGKEILLDIKQEKKKNLPSGGNIIIDTLEGRACLQIVSDSNKNSDNYYTLQIPRGGEYMVLMDDGSRVWLNSESELRYPEAFGKNKREVFLKGEAYFEVKPDETRPFIVNANGLKTVVLGTEFNVQCYPSCVVNVTLVKGSVFVRKDQKGDTDGVQLKPGENVALLGNELYVEKVDVLKYTAWKEGFFYYDNVRLEDILKELGRWFDFTVFFQNTEAKDFRFKFWANRRETTREVLQRLNDTGRVRVQMNDNTVIITM